MVKNMLVMRPSIIISGKINDREDSFYRELRHRGKKYNKQRKGTSGRGNIPGRIDIKQRPCILEKKTRLGDWELDTVIGAGHKGVIVSMVERTSKLN
nr:hypothetical protein [Candidatus Rhabdochlamydia oedothoracis]